MRVFPAKTAILKRLIFLNPLSSQSIISLVQLQSWSDSIPFKYLATILSDFFQPSNSIRVSLWLQWTLPRVVANLYSLSAVGDSAVCVSAELEDLTASIDYSDTMLQMQYKVGAFNISHFEHRWVSLRQGDSLVENCWLISWPDLLALIMN